MGMPTQSAEGLRLFGGHTIRVAGAQALTTMGVEVNKVRILARHSGDAILRYVADAPVKSLRSDLGLCSASAASSSSSAVFGPQGQGTSALVQARVRTLEAAMQRLEASMQTHAQDMVGS